MCVAIDRKHLAAIRTFQREVISDLREFYIVDHHKTLLQALRHRDADALVDSIKKDIEDGVVAAGREAIAARSSDQNTHRAAGEL